MGDITPRNVRKEENYEEGVSISPTKHIKTDVKSPKKYQELRGRIVKPSMYLLSPYDVRVHDSKLPLKENNLVTFAWTSEKD
ncbi:hypothetical protein LIER_37314 [Lithospermum erythrorhizon]|uniref:Uncharacterized protein n=1 Tax=Lithospermum erythrorhizon TaxID=34254 RepID=A0AAV3PMZ9_LITER